MVLMEYFDTGNDPRILLLEASAKVALKLAGRKIPGLRRGVLEEPLKKIDALLKKVRWSYLPKNDLIRSEMVKELDKNANELWKIVEENRLKEKDDLVYKFLRFFVKNIMSFKDRLFLPDKPSSAVDVKFVKVISVQKHPKAEKLYIAWVTDGSEKFEVVTNDPTVKSGEVLLLSFLPPKEFMGVVSEGMFLGGNGIRRGKEDDIGKRPELSEIEDRRLSGEVLGFIKANL